MDKLLAVLGVLVLLAISIPLTAFTVSTLWLWFIVPLGVPVMGMAQSYGVSILVQYLAIKMGKRVGDTHIAEGVILQVAKSIAALLVGWITLQFM